MTQQAPSPEAPDRIDPVAPACEPGERSGRAQFTTLVVGGALALLLVPYLPIFSLWASTVRLAVVLPLGAWGLGKLLGLAWDGDRAARAFVALAAWYLVAGLASPEPRLSLGAALVNDREALFLVAFLGCWGIGRSLPRSSSRIIAGVLAGGLALNALFALLQAAADGYGILALSEDRALGFAGSSVFLGAFMTGALPFSAAAMARLGSRWVLGLPALTLFVAAADLSGSRSALLLGVPLAVLALWPQGWRRLLLGLGACALGLVLAASVATTVAAGTDRLSGDGGGGLSPRVAMWRAGVEVAFERPVTGWGPGRFRSATGPEVTASFAAAEGPDRLFFDAHNLVVEQLVTTGIVGVVLLGAVGWAVARRARGPLAWFGGAVVLSWMVEPSSVTSAPVALLALGLACAPRGSPAPDIVASKAPARRVLGGVAVVLVLAASVQAGRVLVAARDLYLAETEQDLDAIVRVREAFPRDASLADTEARVQASYVGPNASGPMAEGALRSARRATELEPSRHLWWLKRGVAELAFGPGDRADRRAAARDAWTEGLERNPWSVSLLSGLLGLAREEGDDAEAKDLTRRLCEVDACPADDPGGDAPPG